MEHFFIGTRLKQSLQTARRIVYDCARNGPENIVFHACNPGMVWHSKYLYNWLLLLCLQPFLMSVILSNVIKYFLGLVNYFSQTNSQLGNKRENLIRINFHLGSKVNFQVL